MIGYDVHCHICGKRWGELDQGVRFILTDHVWECCDQGACMERWHGESA